MKGGEPPVVVEPHLLQLQPLQAGKVGEIGILQVHLLQPVGPVEAAEARHLAAHVQPPQGGQTQLPKIHLFIPGRQDYVAQLPAAAERREVRHRVPVVLKALDGGPLQALYIRDIAVDNGDGFEMLQGGKVRQRHLHVHEGHVHEVREICKVAHVAQLNHGDLLARLRAVEVVHGAVVIGHLMEGLPLVVAAELAVADAVAHPIVFEDIAHVHHLGHLCELHVDAVHGRRGSGAGRGCGRRLGGGLRRRLRRGGGLGKDSP